MRVLLYQSAKGLFATSGGYKSNLTVLRHLASQGHVVQQVIFAYESEIQDYSAEQKSDGRKMPVHKENLRIPCGTNAVGKIRTSRFTMPDGVRVVALDADDLEVLFPSEKMRALTTAFIEEQVLPLSFVALILFLSSIVDRFQPTHIIFNDSLPLKLTSMMTLPSHVRRAMIIHTAEQLPFGPFAGGIAGGACSPREHHLLQRVEGIWSVSDTIRKYAATHGNLETEFILHHPWNYLEDGSRKFPKRRQNWDEDTVLMINFCPLKGSDIVLPLARRCPDLNFVVVKSWGAKLYPQSLEALEELPNVRVRKGIRDMESLWDTTKVLLVPSLWCEAWGLVVIEAQIRGIPVISSDAGAIPEAKLNVPYIIPVKQISGERDGDGYFIEPQNIDPWEGKLRGLMTDRKEYERVSDLSREVTTSWVGNLSPAAQERWLFGMMGK